VIHLSVDKVEFLFKNNDLSCSEVCGRIDAAAVLDLGTTFNACHGLWKTSKMAVFYHQPFPQQCKGEKKPPGSRVAGLLGLK
jgi:hypothetical protein